MAVGREVTYQHLSEVILWGENRATVSEAARGGAASGHRTLIPTLRRLLSVREIVDMAGSGEAIGRLDESWWDKRWYVDWGEGVGGAAKPRRRESS